MADKPLPKQIQAQLDEAERIQQELAKQSAPQGNTEPPEPEPSAKDDQPVKGDVNAEAPVSDKAQDEFKRKYDVLNGKYNKEVPRLHQQLNEATDMIKNLNAEIEKLKQKPAPEEKPEPLVTSKDEEVFGADLLDVSRRVAKEEVKAVLARLSNIERALSAISQIPDKVKQIETRQVESAEEQFWGKVYGQITNWDEINADPDWIQFLDTRAVGSVRTHRQLAEDAIANGDSQAIVEMVQLWEQRSGKAEQRKKVEKTNQELQSQTQPGKAKASPPPDTTKGRIWTGEEYQRAFDPRLSITMDAAEVAKLQEAADLAYAEGRVRW